MLAVEGAYRAVHATDFSGETQGLCLPCCRYMCGCHDSPWCKCTPIGKINMLLSCYYRGISIHCIHIYVSTDRKLILVICRLHNFALSI